MAQQRTRRAGFVSRERSEGAGSPSRWVGSRDIPARAGVTWKKKGCACVSQCTRAAEQMQPVGRALRRRWEAQSACSLREAQTDPRAVDDDTRRAREMMTDHAALWNK